MESKSKLKFNILVFLSVLAISLAAILNNSGHGLMISGLVVVLVFSFFVRRINTFSRGKRYIPTVLFLMDIVCISFIVFLDSHNISYILYYVLAVDAAFLMFSSLNAVISVLSYFSYISIEYSKYIKYNYFDLQYLLPIYVNKSFYFIFIFGAIYITAYQIKSKQELKKIAMELESKTSQLEVMNKKYRETMNALEEITALRERNRIASEIHDTVGHTLTTVLIEIEAGKRLLSKNFDKAMEKFNLSQEQVRKGLDNIRNSVRTLKDGNDILSIIPSLYVLVQETERHAGVSIKCFFSPIPALRNEVGKVLYKALQEGLTNGIRHGQSTEFVCYLSFIENRIIFSLKDNGKGFNNISLGYGLSIMKEQVEELGGTLNISSYERQGCCLEVEIPIKMGDMYEKNKCSNS